MIERQIDSPMPIPSDFVVKKGWKIRFMAPQPGKFVFSDHYPSMSRHRQCNLLCQNISMERIPDCPIAATVEAEAQAASRCDQVRDALVRDLEAARYSADRAFRQYDAIDPQNRLIAAELELRWNSALTTCRRDRDHDCRA